MASRDRLRQGICRLAGAFDGSISSLVQFHVSSVMQVSRCLLTFFILIDLWKTFENLDVERVKYKKMKNMNSMGTSNKSCLLTKITCKVNFFSDKIWSTNEFIFLDAS